jgi:hypothetical protein
MEIWWPSKLNLSNEAAFREFATKMVKRLAQGFARYGAPDRRKKYLTRLVLELRAYRKTGNAEHLYNIANYAHLESIAPEHPKFHHESGVDSVTRGRGLE